MEESFSNFIEMTVLLFVFIFMILNLVVMMKDILLDFVDWLFDR